MKLIKDLYNYRELLKTNITKDIGGKYKHYKGNFYKVFRNIMVICKPIIANYSICFCVSDNIKK